MEVDVVEDVEFVLADVVAMFHGLYPSCLLDCCGLTEHEVIADDFAYFVVLVKHAFSREIFCNLFCGFVGRLADVADAVGVWGILVGED